MQSTLEMDVKVRVTMSWWDIIKCRIAGFNLLKSHQGINAELEHRRK